MTSEVQHRITSSVVPIEFHFAVPPRFLGDYAGEGCASIKDWAGRFCATYRDREWNLHDEWHFFELSNGGFYMAPANIGRVALRWHKNRYSDMMGADGFGIIVTLYALDNLAQTTRDRTVIDRYRQLREFAIEHVEALNIQRAIDD